MAGLLAWAADVVGGGGSVEGEDGNLSYVVFTPEQQRYAWDLDRKADSLRRSIQDLRVRIPSQDISKSLPHLHAHSVASNASLELQLNAHSTTREQAQLRELALQEDNTAYEKAISTCQKKIEEKMQEAEILQAKLKDMNVIEEELKAEIETLLSNQTGVLENYFDGSESPKVQRDHPKAVLVIKQMEEKKNELSLLEDHLRNLENEWLMVQQNSLKKPSPAQREKILERQLHDLIEQLTAKQVQAESLMTEIKARDLEFQKLNRLRRRIENVKADGNITRNRFGNSTPDNAYSDVESQQRQAGRNDFQQKLMLTRALFVLYVLAIQVLVFIKISCSLCTLRNVVLNGGTPVLGSASHSLEIVGRILAKKMEVSLDVNTDVSHFPLPLHYPQTTISDSFIPEWV